MGKLLTSICLMTFIGLSTFSPLLAEKYKFIPWELGECLTNNDFTHMKEFNPEKFFNGTWYEIFNYNTFVFDMKGKCAALQSKISDNNVDLLFYQYTYNQSKWETVGGVVHLSELKGSEFIIHYPLFEGLKHIMVPVSVVYTDYENYAVFYSCQSVYGMRLEMSWVSTRQRGDISKWSEIEQVIEHAGLSFVFFHLSEHKSCDQDEPKL